MVSIEKGLDDKPILKFYDENKNLMGVNINDGQGIQLVSNYYKMLNLPENRESLRELNKLSISKGKSLSNVQTELKQISKSTGISKERIKGVSDISLNQKVYDKNEDDKIRLNDDIENGTTKNNTRFSFLIRDKDGKYKECPNLEQVGGITPDSKVAKSNYDGSKVQMEQVNSLYRIKSSSNIEYLLTANIGSQGIIELGIGQKDRTRGVNGSNLATVTTPLKTSSTYRTTAEVRRDLNGTYDGINQSHERVLEGEIHINRNCETDKDEFDGEYNTGHIHEDIDEDVLNQPVYTEQEFYEMALYIINQSDIIGDIYNRHDIVAYLEEASKENPDFTKEELSDIVMSEMEESAEQEHQR